jgi:Superfamily I DNA and RNA helicases
MFESLKNSAFSSGHQKYRSLLFLEICKAVYKYYYSKLKAEKKIDFDDMIFSAIDCLDKSPAFKYKHIIVDEFQDISTSRMMFLRKLINHGNSKLFAVGDDWQAIFRFAGCDLGLFLGFQNIFEYSCNSFITSTHRNSVELQNIIEPFIELNPEQLKKHLISQKHVTDPVQIIKYDGDETDPFKLALTLISKSDETARVLVLGRNNGDIESILGPDVKFDRRTRKIHFDKLSEMCIDYKTVHASKGLEEDFVILINANDDKYGFPNKVEDDPLLSLVLSSPSEFEFSEERRLFYVSLTRACLRTFILTKKYAESSFVAEIEPRCKVLGEVGEAPSEELIKCPRCGSGHLVMRNDKSGNQFYGCSNFPYCDYTINDLRAVTMNKRCPRCDDFLVLRKGEHCFLGCHNYPVCTYTESRKQK